MPPGLAPLAARGPVGTALASPSEPCGAQGAARASDCPSARQVEKSLQRIQNGQRNAMYTSQQSVENKVGGIPGWQALLTAVGFRLDPPASGLPAAVFFPTSDPGDRLQQCSSTLQSLLGEPPRDVSLGQPAAGRAKSSWAADLGHHGPSPGVLLYESPG